jgi:hypothetical protein
MKLKLKVNGIKNSPRPLAIYERTWMESIKPPLIVVANFTQQIHPLFLLDAICRLNVQWPILARDL